MLCSATRGFLRKAASAKGRASDIYESIPTEARDYLFPGHIVTVQKWTEQEEQERTHQWNNSTNRTWSSAWSNWA